MDDSQKSESGGNDSGCLFNMAYAKKLSVFDGNKEQLLKDLKGIVRDTFSIDANWMPDFVMDPFTCLAMINRQITDSNRIKLCKEMKDYWEIDAVVPSSFRSIPVANNQNTIFCWGSRISNGEPSDKIEERYRNSVDQLWAYFRVFVDFSYGRASEEEFIDSFNRVLDLKGVGLRKLTVSLYWINYDFYLSLDSPIQN